MAEVNAMVRSIVEALRQSLQMPGPVGEGMDGSHGDLLGTGDTYDTTTWPEAVEVVDHGDGTGLIRYPFKCMVRHKHYVAQVPTASSDTQHPANVVARFDVALSGKVFISEIHYEGSKDRRCGDCIVRRLQALNGSILHLK